MRRLSLFLIVPLLLTLSVSRARADESTDFVRRAFFSPEILMANQRKIGLTPEQRETFVRAMTEAQTDMLPVKLEMSEAAADLALLLEGPRVDEEAALQAAQRVLELEQRTKLRHMELLVRIKNLLTVEQQRRLREIRASKRRGLN